MPNEPTYNEQLNMLKNWVLARMDEITPDGANYDPPVSTLQEELKEAAADVLMMARTDLVYPASISPDPMPELTHDEQLQATFFEAPEDMIRFLRVKMGGWNRSVDQLLSVSMPDYQQQAIPGLRATASRPKAFLVPKAEGKRNIELYPAGDTIVSMLYVKRLDPVDMPKELRDAMIWKAAERCLVILRNVESARVAANNAAMKMQALNTGVLSPEMMRDNL